MTGNVYTYRMPAGIPGAVNRELAATLEPGVLSPTNTPAAYGDPVKMGSDGRIQALVPGDTIAALYGFLVRPFPGQDQVYASEGFGASAPAPLRSCTVMKRGYMSVVVQGSTVPASGGPVFIRLAGTLPTPGKVDGLEGAADATAGNTLAIPPANTYFKGAPDAAGNTEIAYNM